MSQRIARVAVADAVFAMDRPYDYLIPEELECDVQTGKRVQVPFARGNHTREGIVLSVTDHSDYDKLKSISAVLDEQPVLTPAQIQLALFMQQRFFCTVYDAVKAMLPVGMWFNDDGERRTKDKFVEVARLSVPPEDAAEIADNKRRKSPQQSNLLDLLCSFGSLPSLELLRFTGASRQSLKALVNAGLVEYFYREVYRRPEIFVGEKEPLPVLNDEQQKAFEGISDLACSGKAGAALLFGVTGSGKTSVYIHLINEQLQRGKTAILLVPEIALTPQMLQTFSSYFGNDIAVLHSSLSAGERFDEWKRIKKGEARLVIGTRSAVFAPVDDLGIIIIDEEQEETYKSENTPRYNACDIAKYCCAKSNCLLLLGSATPNIISRYYASIGRYAFFTLPTRYNERALPEVKIVDMKDELRRGNGSDISRLLRDEIAENISRGEQSILFINRRGANKLITCGECGYTFKCPRCSVSLTYHIANRRLMCHYCGFSKRVDDSCPDCGGKLVFSGAGTQLIEEELQELFPDVGIIRMDTDTVTPVGSHEQLFEKFRNENIPIMVGTQMVTKGLNFENVTLVGVISADQSLYSGDYRASERTFSLITQVVGRSGRGEKPGRAVIQTFTPNNETIQQASGQDYEDFFRSEIELRHLQNIPPFCDLLSVTASGTDESSVISACRSIRTRLEQTTAHREDVAILGPAPLPVVKVNNRFRYRVNICCRADKEIRDLIAGIVIESSTDKNYKGVSVFADNDPSD